MNKTIEERKSILKKIIDDCNDEIDLDLLENLLTDIYHNIIKLRTKKQESLEN